MIVHKVAEKLNNVVVEALSVTVEEIKKEISSFKKRLIGVKEQCLQCTDDLEQYTYI